MPFLRKNPAQAEGRAKLLLGDTPESLEEREIGPGEGWYVPAGLVHRVIALDDYVAFEISTPEVNDVERMEDDSGRSSGRIASEH